MADKQPQQCKLKPYFSIIQFLDNVKDKDPLYKYKYIDALFNQLRRDIEKRDREKKEKDFQYQHRSQHRSQYNAQYKNQKRFKFHKGR